MYLHAHNYPMKMFSDAWRWHLARLQKYRAERETAPEEETPDWMVGALVVLIFTIVVLLFVRFAPKADQPSSVTSEAALISVSAMLRI